MYFVCIIYVTLPHFIPTVLEILSNINRKIVLSHSSSLLTKMELRTLNMTFGVFHERQINFARCVPRNRAQSRISSRRDGKGTCVVCTYGVETTGAERFLALCRPPPSILDAAGVSSAITPSRLHIHRCASRFREFSVQGWYFGGSTIRYDLSADFLVD